MKRILLDAGPLVAFLNGRDRYHPWAQDVLSGIEPPLFTCESVLSEACFLVRKLPGGPEAVLELGTRGILAMGLSAGDEIEAIRRLMKKYAEVPMSFADACLVRMTELHRESCVLTLDRDFGVYRRNGRQVVPMIMP